MLAFIHLPANTILINTTIFNSYALLLTTFFEIKPAPFYQGVVMMMAIVVPHHATFVIPLFLPCNVLRLSLSVLDLSLTEALNDQLLIGQVSLQTTKTGG